MKRFLITMTAAGLCLGLSAQNDLTVYGIAQIIGNEEIPAWTEKDSPNIIEAATAFCSFFSGNSLT